MLTSSKGAAVVICGIFPGGPVMFAPPADALTVFQTQKNEPETRRALQTVETTTADTGEMRLWLVSSVSSASWNDFKNFSMAPRIIRSSPMLPYEARMFHAMAHDLKHDTWPEPTMGARGYR